MTADPPVSTAPAGGRLGGTVNDDGVPWRRLSVRVFHLGLIRMVVSLATGYLGMIIRDDPVWLLLGGAAVGLLGALADLKRWQTSRYRITPQRVEMRTGWLARKHRFVARDRIRSVDSSARLLPRLLGLRTVHIGSGDSESPFRLDALDRRHASRVERELMPGRAGAVPVPSVSAMDEVDTHAPAASDAAAADSGTADSGTVIARLRWAWVPLNAFTVWAVFGVVGPLFGLHWALRPFGVDLLAIGRDLLGWDSRGLVGNVGLLLLVAYPLGVVVAAAAFVVEHGKFELVRTGTAPDTALVTRRGLLTTRTVQRSDARTRGIAFEEPLLWRWLRITRTSLLLTGLAVGGETTGGDVLPRTRLPEARELAARIVPDGARPLEAPLRRHPRGALIRRLGWAVYHPPWCPARCCSSRSAAPCPAGCGRCRCCWWR